MCLPCIHGCGSTHRCAVDLPGVMPLKKRDFPPPRRTHTRLPACLRGSGAASASADLQQLLVTLPSQQLPLPPCRCFQFADCSRFAAVICSMGSETTAGIIVRKWESANFRMTQKAPVMSTIARGRGGKDRRPDRLQ